MQSTKKSPREAGWQKRSYEKDRPIPNRRASEKTPTGKSQPAARSGPKAAAGYCYRIAIVMNLRSKIGNTDLQKARDQASLKRYRALLKKFAATKFYYSDGTEIPTRRPQPSKPNRPVKFHGKIGVPGPKKSDTAPARDPEYQALLKETGLTEEDVHKLAELFPPQGT